MPCDCCTRARERPESGLYHVDCDGCKARMLARSPDFWESMRDGFLTARYKSALRAIFGERWAEGHALACAWAPPRDDRGKGKGVVATCGREEVRGQTHKEGRARTFAAIIGR